MSTMVNSVSNSQNADWSDIGKILDKSTTTSDRVLEKPLDPRIEKLRQTSENGFLAVHYAQLGLKVIPVYHPDDDDNPPNKENKRGKAPVRCLCGRGVKDATNDIKQIIKWWTKRPNANVGIVLGESGLIGLDMDGEEGRQSLQKLESKLGKLPETWTAISGNGGEHLYFKSPDFAVLNKVEWREKLDIRHHGGYLVAPPSVHQNGNVYQWKYSPTQVPLAELPESWLNALPRKDTGVAKKTTDNIPSKDVIVSERQTIKTSCNDATGFTDNDEPFAQPISTESASNTTTLQPATKKEIFQCRQYMKKMDAAISGKGGHHQTFKVACVIFHDFGLTQVEGFPLLLEYNTRCQPEWTISELEHKMKDALQKPNSNKPAGWRRLQPKHDQKPAQAVADPPGSNIPLPQKNGHRDILFSSTNHDDNASKVIEIISESCTIKTYNNCFYIREEAAVGFVKKDDKEIGGLVQKALKRCYFEGESIENGEKIIVKVPVKNDVYHVREMVANMLLNSVIRLSTEQFESGWIGDGVNPYKNDKLAFFANCIRNLSQRQTLPISDDWFIVADDLPEYNENAEASNFIKAYRDGKFKDAPDDYRMLMEHFGLAISNYRGRQKMLIIVGLPGGGKGTWVDIIQKIMRSRFQSLNSSMFDSNFTYAGLVGKTVGIFVDGKFDMMAGKKAHNFFSSVVADDRIRVEEKGEKPYDVKLGMQVTICCNKLPNIPTSEGEMQRRIMCLKWSNEDVVEVDNDYGRQFDDEIPGIIKLMIDAAEENIARGKYMIPNSSDEMYLDIQRRTDSVYAFFMDIMIVTKNMSDTVAAKDINALYKEYCRLENRGNGVSSPDFRQRMSSLEYLGFKSPKRDGNYHGITINLDALLHLGFSDFWLGKFDTPNHQTAKDEPTDKPVETQISSEHMIKQHQVFAKKFADKTGIPFEGLTYAENGDTCLTFFTYKKDGDNWKDYCKIVFNLNQGTALFPSKSKKPCRNFDVNKTYTDMWMVIATLAYGSNSLENREKAKQELLSSVEPTVIKSSRYEPMTPRIPFEIDTTDFCSKTGYYIVKEIWTNHDVRIRFQKDQPDAPFVMDIRITCLKEWEEFVKNHYAVFGEENGFYIGDNNWEGAYEQWKQRTDDLERSMPEGEQQRLLDKDIAEWEALPRDDQGKVITEQIFPDDPLPIHFSYDGGQSHIDDDQWETSF